MGWRLKSPGGEFIPLQARVLDRWADGSIRWVLLDFQATVEAGLTSTYSLLKEADAAQRLRPSISITSLPSALDIDTGTARFRLDSSAPFLISSAAVAGRSLLDCQKSGVRVLGADGTNCHVRWELPVVEEPGPLRTVVRANGTATGPDIRLELVARFHFYAGSGVVRHLLTVRNPHRAKHAGGIWELGDAGSILLKELAIVLSRSAEASEIRFCTELEQGLSLAHGEVSVYQDSSGGDSWESPVHVNRYGVVPNAFRGYTVTADGTVRRGQRSSPIVFTNGDQTGLGAAIPYFWQNFPRRLAGSRGQLELSFWPAEYGDLHELQGGEQKTHECFLLFGDETVTEMPLAWCRARLLGSALPEWYAAAEAVPFLTPAASDPHPDYMSLVNAAIEGDDTFLHKRERVDEFGWRHFGDIYADHEAVRQKGEQRLVSHYNNQYDPVAGFAIQFMRSGDPRWWTQCVELAAHVVDIDLYHTDEDKSAYNRGLFWHTVHYIDAGRATHRSYPNAPGSHGGGPASEHNYTTGLMLHHFLTGDPASREAALGLAQFVIDMDDGAKTVFRWLHRGATGLASASGSPLYHGPGRGSGNSLNALVDGHRLSADRCFLAKAEEIIRRAVHPREDIAALTLLDAERKWFYTMFLQALGKYLEHKAQLGELDAPYAYGRESLLHFARWMADCEYPYLDKPEILEFPTETWSGQDMRKHEVFRAAAMHTHGAERARFLERADFFFDDAVGRLGNMPTRSLARPVVLLLSHGFTRRYFEEHPGVSRPAPQLAGVDFGQPTSFVPQKVRAIRRAKILAGLAAVLGLAGLIAILFVLPR